MGKGRLRAAVVEGEADGVAHVRRRVVVGIGDVVGPSGAGAALQRRVDLGAPTAVLGEPAERSDEDALEPGEARAQAVDGRVDRLDLGEGAYGERVDGRRRRVGEARVARRAQGRDGRRARRTWGAWSWRERGGRILEGRAGGGGDLAQAVGVLGADVRDDVAQVGLVALDAVAAAVQRTP